MILTGRLVGQYSDSSRVSGFLQAQERAKETEVKRETRRKEEIGAGKVNFREMYTGATYCK